MRPADGFPLLSPFRATSTTAGRRRCAWVFLCACVGVLLGACGSGGSVDPAVPPARMESLHAPVSAGHADFKDMIEALFFGTGPMARLDSPGCDNSLQRMRGWPIGSRVRVVAYGSVDAERRAAVQQTLQQVNEVFGATLTAAYETRDSRAEPEGTAEDEIRVFGVEAPRAPTFCGGSATNCQVVRYNAGVFKGSRVILSKPFAPASSGIVSHELGHAFGLCHIDPARGGFDPSISIMGSTAAGRWTDLDLEAFRRVYGAGLSPADPRQQFVRAGLIN
jgi:hypothetical protein